MGKELLILLEISGIFNSIVFFSYMRNFGCCRTCVENIFHWSKVAVLQYCFAHDSSRKVLFIHKRAGWIFTYFFQLPISPQPKELQTSFCTGKIRNFLFFHSKENLIFHFCDFQYPSLCNLIFVYIVMSKLLQFANRKMIEMLFGLEKEQKCSGLGVVFTRTANNKTLYNPYFYYRLR